MQRGPFRSRDGPPPGGDEKTDSRRAGDRCRRRDGAVCSAPAGDGSRGRWHRHLEGDDGQAKEKGADNLLYADVRQIPFRDGSFETALLIHILHLVTDWTRVVRESARVARDTVISAVETAEGMNLRDAYLELRNQMGYPLVRFEKGEQVSRTGEAAERDQGHGDRATVGR